MSTTASLTKANLLFGVLMTTTAAFAQADPLPAWTDGAAKARIMAFVQAVTDQASKDYVAPADRIAVFDNDGTLWSEQPAYFQLAFAIDRVKALAPGIRSGEARSPSRPSSKVTWPRSQPRARKAWRSWS